MHASERPLARQLELALETGPNLIHIVTGPHQVGKTTVASTIAERWSGPVRHAATDEMLTPSGEWLHPQSGAQSWSSSVDEMTITSMAKL